jgi:hypothetical protein
VIELNIVLSFEEKLVILAYAMLNFSLSFKISRGEKIKDVNVVTVDVRNEIRTAVVHF